MRMRIALLGCAERRGLGRSVAAPLVQPCEIEPRMGIGRIEAGSCVERGLRTIQVALSDESRAQAVVCRSEVGPLGDGCLELRNSLWHRARAHQSVARFDV